VKPRLVLDTNVCLDLFVFDDPDVAPLRAALRQGAVVAVTHADCRDEWLRVLDYPQLALDAPRRGAARAAFDATMQLLALDLAAPTVDAGDAAGDLSPPRLPRCADPDVQKFLQLAQASGARWLLSRDAAVLALARRCARDHRFAILPPQAWSMVLLER
jgi:predicted nucleic acid-binding protein